MDRFCLRGMAAHLCICRQDSEPNSSPHSQSHDCKRRCHEDDGPTLTTASKLRLLLHSKRDRHEIDARKEIVDVFAGLRREEPFNTLMNINRSKPKASEG